MNFEGTQFSPLVVGQGQKPDKKIEEWSLGIFPGMLQREEGGVREGSGQSVVVS